MALPAQQGVQASAKARPLWFSSILRVCLTPLPYGHAGILYNVTGGPDLGLHEVMQVGEVINELADNSAQCIFGTVEDER